MARQLKPQYAQRLQGMLALGAVLGVGLGVAISALITQQLGIDLNAPLTQQKHWQVALGAMFVVIVGGGYLGILLVVGRYTRGLVHRGELTEKEASRLYWGEIPESWTEEV